MRALLILSVIGCSSRPSPPPIRTTFDSDVAGWSVRAFNTDNHDYSLGQIAADGIWDATGGNPGGALTRNDLIGTTDYFAAPAAYLGNLTAYDGGTLRYDLRASDLAMPFDAPQAILEANGVEWLSTGSGSPALTFTSLSVSFVESAWARVDGSSGGFSAGLSAVTGLWIRGEYSSDADHTWLDNVELAN